MCGFCGFTGQTQNNQQVISDMMQKIIHRGPDSEGIHSDEYVTLGFRRLSLIDLESGSQPMYNEDKSVVIVFNGEIYNYVELHDKLVKKGHTFKTQSDTETLVHAYEQYGPDMFKHLRGMFAFVIYDYNKNRIFGARDFFGIKPFYYSVINNNLLSNQADMGMCLALPYLAKNTNKIYPETTIFFNSESKWENLDDIADEQYINNYNSTDLFINIILHEFIHAAHFKNLLAKLGTNKYSTKIINACNMQNNCVPYNISKQLGKYSSFNPLETIACDITKRICDTLDKTSLLPPFNPLKNSPYDNLSGFEKLHYLLFEDKSKKTLSALF